MTRRTILIAVMAACAVAVLAGVLFWLLTDDPPRAAVVRAERTSAIYAPIDSRTRDSAPLTVAELFGAAELTSGEVTLARGGTEELRDCAEAVWGDAVTAAAGGCTQVLRARYGTADGAVSGQFTVFNMPDAASADRLVTALSARDGGFVRLARGVPDGFDATRSQANARALGHYVTVGWVGPVGPGPRVDLTRHQLALDGVNRAFAARVVDAS
jgi:hypothetical protein